MNLDDLKIYKKLDNGQVGESIELLPDQINQVLQEARLIKIPKEYSKVNQVIVAGMGGSNLGTGIIKSVFSDKLKVPVTILAGYQVPDSVDKDALFIISSYSGNTEEPLSVYKEAKKRGAKILGITSDSKKNKLANLMLKDDIPGYLFKPEFNVSNQPRMGLGYGVFGIAVLLAKTGLFVIKPKEIEDVIASLKIWEQKIKPGMKKNNNSAKRMAIELYGQQPVIIGAEFLLGNLRVLRNQFCENSKNFATYLTLPELNHYALESLGNPKSNKKNLTFIFFSSDLYHSRIQKRLILTKQVVKKNKIKVLEYKLTGKTKLEQSFEMLQFGSWVTYYLAMLNNVNPSKIPWVDWFKKELK